MSGFEANKEFSAAPAPKKGRDAEIARLLAAPSHLYFIYSAGLVKIGVSKNWRQRVDSVCYGCPHDAYLILAIPGDREMEAGYHALFHDTIPVESGLGAMARCANS